MKKQNKIILFVLIGLAVLALIIFFSNYHIITYQKYGKKKYRIEKVAGTMQSLRDFAIKDTASIDKIFLADKDNNTILLERKNEVWYVNEEYKARQDFVDVLLGTICDLEITAHVPKTKMDFVLRNLSSTSTKVEIYQNGKLAKVYYVGGSTQDNTGTYMILEGSQEPFEMHIPGFSGFLSTRYITNIYEWRDRILYSYKANEIKSVELNYPHDKENSFVAINNGDNDFELKLLNTNKNMEDVSEMAIKEFLSRFKQMSFEVFMNDTDEYLKLDSILNSNSEICIYTIEDIYGEKIKIKTFPRPNYKDNWDEEGNFYNNDVDRFYGVINDDQDLILFQYINFDPLTKKPEDFKQANAVYNFNVDKLL